MMHQSIATIDSPEFINLQPLEINPLMSSCEIKVLYLGENRNHSYITKDVALEMAKTLRGAPIVGYYRDEKQDFADHGEKVIFDDEGVKFECMTKPYGFVAPDAKVWFQKFEDTDDFGNKTTREYLMTTGYLWTGQYEECKSIIEEGRPQSMELDEENLEGHWSTNTKTGMDFFIINDAIFSKLCILGEDVEPCFEGSSITAPEVSTSFTKIDEDFKKTLYTMMQDLMFALKGGRKMETGETILDSIAVETPSEEVVVEETPTIEETVEEVVETTVEDTEVAEEENTEAPEAIEESEEEITTEEEEGSEDEVAEEISETIEEEILEDMDNEEQSISTETEEDIETTISSEENVEEYVSKEDYSALEAKYTALEEKYNELAEFKLQIEDKEKDALINSFYMLSDEDKSDVIANKSNYSLEDIEAKLSVICFRKKVNFDLEEDKSEDKVENEEKVTTYNLGDTQVSTKPAWLQACINTRDSKK